MYTRRFAFLACSFLLSFFGVAGWLALMPRPSQAGAQSELRVCNTMGGYYPTIQAAIDAAQPGDLIKVAAGVYTESKMVSGSPYNLTITKSVEISGGYTCNNWVARDFTTNVTSIRPSNPAFAVVMIQGAYGNAANFTPALDGFTIQGARSGNHGGGLRIIDADALIRNNLIHDNTAYLLGGGIWVQRGAPLIQNNHIENNHLTPSSGGWGGGIELEGAQATLTGNVIANNGVSDSVGYGGGVAIEGGGPVTLTNNTISGNAAATITSTIPMNDIGYGGGVYVENAPVILIGNVIQNNTANSVFASGFGGAYGYGGGIYILNSPAFTLTGNTIITNTAGYKYYVYLSGGGLEINSSQGVLTGNVIAGNFANGNRLFGNGGGLAAYTSTLTIQGGEIVSNKTAINYEGYGGGLYLVNSSLKLDGTRIENNSAGNSPFYGKGGGLALLNSPYWIKNAIIAKNYAYHNDTGIGGLFAGANSPGTLVNNTLVNNGGQGIRTASPITLTNNIIMGHTTGISLTHAVPVSVTYNDFYANTVNQKGFSLDSTNIVINPQLNPSYHLLHNSPVIDAGTRAHAPGNDFDGEPRPMVGTSGLYRVDIGADEYTGPAQQNVNLDQPGKNILTIIGPGNPLENPGSNSNHDWIGYTVSGGDVSGDGKPDLVFSAEDWAEDADTLNATGRLYGWFNFSARITGTIDLFTDTASLTVTSKYIRQHLGAALTSGDLNGDGKTDLIAGSYENDNDNTIPVTPTVFALWGGSSLAGTRVLTTTVPADFMLRAPAQDFNAFSGHNALATGDLNGDGTADLIVGDHKGDDGALADTGAVFVIFGNQSLGGLHDLSVTPADFTLYGPAADAHLGPVAVGRVNAGAGIDLVARSDTAAYVFLGPISSGTAHLSSQAANITVTDLQGGGMIVGDLTGDGQDDLILGSGSTVYVIPGPLNDGESFNAADRAALTLTGVNAASFAMGDVTGDAYPDLIIGTPSSKKAFVVAGGSSFTGTAPIEEVAAAIFESGLRRNLGFDVTTGDLDFDGRPDLIVSTWQVEIPTHPAKFEDAGEVYVIYSAHPAAPPLWQIYLPLVLKN